MLFLLITTDYHINASSGMEYIFTFLLLAVYRAGSQIVTPGVDIVALQEFFEAAQGTILGMLNLFTGGNIGRMTIFATGIMPYISASIILQLLQVVWPYLERISKEGDLGRKKITQYTRYGTVLIAIIQSFSFAIMMENMKSPSGLDVVIAKGWGFRMLTILTMTNYDDSFKKVEVIYPKENLTETLGEVLEKHGKKQVRIAETEKYPHVTFFFSGGRETEFEGEKRILCPSPKVATYDLKPEMSAFEIKDAIVPELEKQEADFICLNFANTDMVGHTGVMEAAVKAAEAVDSCLREVVTTARNNGYTSIIIADHGNSETMINEDGSPNTAHTTNPVPLILVEQDKEHEISDGILGDIAPTILELLGIEQPEAMTRKSLLNTVLTR